MNEIFWPGTAEESGALLKAVENNCDCGVFEGKEVKTACGVHQLVKPDMDRWNHLIFARRRAGRMVVEELGPQFPVERGQVYSPHYINLLMQISK